MVRYGLRLFYLSMIILLVNACAPELDDIQSDPVPSLTFERSGKLSKFSVNELPFPMTQIGELSNESIDETLERLVLQISMAKAARDKSLVHESLKEFWGLVDDENIFVKSDFSESSYLKAILGYSYPSIKRELDETAGRINESWQRIPALLKRLSDNYKWPTPDKFQLSSFEHIMKDYFSLVPKQLRAFEIYESLVGEIEEGLLQGDHFKEIAEVQAALNQVTEARNFSEALKRVTGLIKELDFSISDNTRDQLNKGFLIANSVERTVDPITALSLLVDAWLHTAHDDRQELFASQSEDLYEFLNSRNPAELKCYIPRNNCTGPIQFLIRELAILPEIEGYGVRTIRAQIDRAGQELVNEAVKIEVIGYLKNLHAVVSDEIKVGIDEGLSSVEEIKRNPNAYLSELVSDWQDRSSSHLFEVRLNGLLDGGHSKTSDFQVRRLGLFLRLLNEVISVENRPELLDSLYLSVLRVVLDLSGVKQFDGSFVPSMYVSSKDGIPVEYLLDVSNITFPVALTSDNNPIEFWNIHGDLMLGLANSLGHFKEWENGPFDKRLGKLKAVEFLNGQKSEALNQEVFPEDVIYVMTLANLMMLVKNLTYGDYGLHVANSRYEFLPYNKDVPKPPTQTAMAAVMSKSSEGHLFVQTNSMVKMIDVLHSTVNGTLDLSKTQSDLVIEALGKPGVEGFQSAMRDLQLLMAASSNFLSHYLETPENDVFSSLSLVPPHRFDFGEPDFDSGLGALESYQRTFQFFPISVYKWVYLDLYNYLSSQMVSSSNVTAIQKLRLNLIYIRWQELSAR